jgi:hypothetical protein
MGHDDGALVGSIVRLVATNRRRTAGIDAEFEAKERVVYALGVKAIPVGMENGDDFGADGRANGVADNKVFREFSGVASRIPGTDIGTVVGKHKRGFDDSFAVLLKEEYTFVNVVAIIHGDILIERLRAPKLRGNFNDESGRR